MSKTNFIKIFILLTAANFLCCKQPYVPPAIKGNVNYLVVDGVVVAGDDSTIVTLSRAQNISDSTYNITNFETGAVVTVVGVNGDIYSLTEQGAGRYVADTLFLNPGELYQLKIVTSNGAQYLSDSLPVKYTPPVDSVNWVQTNDGVTVYANTHDPQNSSLYYRWQYVETWEYHSGFDSYYYYENGQVLPRDSAQHVYTCWRTQPSTNLVLASSAGLSSDVIYEQPLVFIPSTSEKLGVEYSIYVQQYSITKDAYNFWQTLQKNTEQTGSIFDAQPSQLTGNVHNVSNPAEPVLGYVSFSSVQNKRIFISNTDLPTWDYTPLSAKCSRIVVSLDPDSMAFYYGTGYVPVVADQTTLGLIGYYSSISTCVDCTLSGGTLDKPLFWPF